MGNQGASADAETGSRPTGQAELHRLDASRFDPARGQRVLVCGGRDFKDEALMFAVLDRIDRRGRIDLIIEGGQRTRERGTGVTGGADYWACRWSYARGRAGMRFDADWLHLGKAAGPIRNQQMLDESKPSLVVAFPGGQGTADMVRRARAAGVPIEHVVPASAIEAATAGETTKIGSTEGESAAREAGDAQPPHPIDPGCKEGVNS